MSLISRTKAIETILTSKSPYLLSSTPFCDMSLVMWTTTKEKWAVCVVTSMQGKSHCHEVGFQTNTKLPHFLLSNSRLEASLIPSPLPAAILQWPERWSGTFARYFDTALGTLANILVSASMSCDTQCNSFIRSPT